MSMSGSQTAVCSCGGLLRRPRRRSNHATTRTASTRQLLHACAPAGHARMHACMHVYPAHCCCHPHPESNLHSHSPAHLLLEDVRRSAEAVQRQQPQLATRRPAAAGRLRRHHGRAARRRAGVDDALRVGAHHSAWGRRRSGPCSSAVSAGGARPEAGRCGGLATMAR
eukprot:357000-Chlamydomonas_euryale.AAC.10